MSAHRIRFGYIFPAVASALAAVSAVQLPSSAGAIRGSHAKQLKFSKNGLPNLNGVVLSLAHSGQPQPADTTSYIVTQLLKKWGANISYTLGHGAPEIASALGGHIQAVGMGWTTSLNAGLIAFGPAQPGQSYVFYVTPGIKTVSQLKGKSVMSSDPGGDTDQLVTDLLKESHLARSDVNSLYTPDESNEVQAFATGRISAFWGAPSDAFTLRQDGAQYRILANAEKVAPYVADSYESATRQWLSQNYAYAEAIDLAWLYAAHIMATNRAEWISYAQAYTQGTIPFSALAADWVVYRNARIFPDGPIAFEKPNVIRNFKIGVRTGQILNRSVDAPVASYAVFGPWRAALKQFGAHRNAVR